MPVTDADLNQPAHAHLLRPATETVFSALRVWRDTPGRQEWWWLVIEHDAQRYTALRFSELRDLLVQRKRRTHMNTPLTKLPARRDNPDDPDHPLPGVVTPIVVDGAVTGAAAAREIAHTSPGQVVVIVQDGQFQGIISITSRTFAFADKPLLDLLEDFEMGGESETIIMPHSTPNDEPPPGDPPNPPDVGI